MAFVDWQYANGISSLMMCFLLGSGDSSYVGDSLQGYEIDILW